MGFKIGEIDLGLVLSKDSFNKDLRGLANSAQQTAANAFKPIGRIIGAALAGGALVKFTKDCLNLGSDLTEVQNVVDTTFGSMSLKADEFAKSALETFGMSEKVAKQYMGTLGAMSKSMGFSTSEAYDMAEAVTGLTGDVEYVVLDELVEGLYPANDLYPANSLYPRTSNAYNITKGRYYSCEYDDFLTKRITQLQIRQEENDIGATVGIAGNTYIIEDNFLVYGMSSDELATIADNTLSVISRISYRPFSADCIGNPCILLGEKVSLNTKREIITSYVLQRTLKGIQGMHDTLSSEGVENYGAAVNSLARSIIQLKGKTNVLTRTVEETNEKITDVEHGLSLEISHTAAQVQAEARRASQAEGALSASIKLNADNIAARVSKDSIISEINMSPEKIKIHSDRVEIEGYVEFSDLSGSGRTTINGDNITTGHLNAGLITSGTIRGKVGFWVESDSSDRVVTINADGIYNAATTYLNDVAVYGSLKDGNGNDIVPEAVQYLNDGWWGNFPTANGWTVTVQNGVITDVS